MGVEMRGDEVARRPAPRGNGPQLHARRLPVQVTLKRKGNTGGRACWRCTARACRVRFTVAGPSRCCSPDGRRIVVSTVLEAVRLAPAGARRTRVGERR